MDDNTVSRLHRARDTMRRVLGRRDLTTRHAGNDWIHVMADAVYDGLEVMAALLNRPDVEAEPAYRTCEETGCGSASAPGSRYCGRHVYTCDDRGEHKGVLCAVRACPNTRRVVPEGYTMYCSDHDDMDARSDDDCNLADELFMEHAAALLRAAE